MFKGIILISTFLLDMVPLDIIKRIFWKREGVVGTGWSWLRIGRDGGHL
jgi:hypothetical protein